MALFSKWYWAVLNPAGFAASKIQDSNGGDANTRVKNYISENPPLGCSASTLATCEFTGTQEDWESFRRDWIQQCTSFNATNFTESTNRTNNACQAEFDAATLNIRLNTAAQNKISQEYITSLLGKDSPMTYLVVLLFVALIIYLLMSK
jgi:hypothetical protein